MTPLVKVGTMVIFGPYTGMVLRIEGDEVLFYSEDLHTPRWVNINSLEEVC